MSNRIVLTMSLDPYLNPGLRPGSVRCLALLRSLAGHDRIFTTLTTSLATQLARCVNTVRAYRDELVEAGYIWWTTDQRTGVTTVMIRSSVEAPSRQAALADMGGAQFFAPIKPRKNLTYPIPAVHPRARPFLPDFSRRICQSQDPLRSADEQMAMLPTVVRVPSAASQARQAAMVAAIRASRKVIAKKQKVDREEGGAGPSYAH